MPTTRQLKKVSANERAEGSESSDDRASFVPPRASFDPRLRDELARLKLVPPTQPEPTRELRPPDLENLPETFTPDAFNFYMRELTPDGGVRLIYRDIVRHWLLSAARFIAWTAGTIFVARFFVHSSFNSLTSLLLIVVCSVGLAAGLRSNLYRTHCIEIHPDGLAVDGRFFSIDNIGENWPILHFKYPNDPSRYILRGIVGTRLVDFATINRVDTNDRMPERLSQDLDLAMEQLWGRREAIFATTF